jgi:hypothetical protein
VKGYLPFFFAAGALAFAAAGFFAAFGADFMAPLLAPLAFAKVFLLTLFGDGIVGPTSHRRGAVKLRLIP